MAKLIALDFGDAGVGVAPIVGDVGGSLISIPLFIKILPAGCWDDVSPGVKTLLYGLWIVDAFIGFAPGLGDMCDLLPINTINGLIVKAHLDKMAQQ